MSPADQILAQTFQPVAEPHGGDAVVAVVDLDCGQGLRGHRILLAELHGALKRAQMKRNLAKRDLALEAVEDLQLFEGVSLDAGAHRLADDRMQVDEALGAKQPVKLALARRVASHQAPERSRLVGREVIDVEFRKALPARHHQIDEGLEGRPLGGRIECPARIVPRPVRRTRGPTEQIFEPGRASERIPFEVQKDVAWRRLGKAAQALTFDHLQRLVARRACAPALELDAGLFAYAHVSLRRTARGSVFAR